VAKGLGNTIKKSTSREKLFFHKDIKRKRKYTGETLRTRMGSQLMVERYSTETKKRRRFVRTKNEGGKVRRHLKGWKGGMTFFRSRKENQKIIGKTRRRGFTTP